MTCSTTKKLTKPLDEPEREFHRLRKAAWRQQPNGSLAIAGRNLFNDETSFIQWTDDGVTKPIFHDNISPEDQGKLDQFTHFRFSSLTEEKGWNQIEEYVQYQDDLWDDPPPSRKVS
ncbi:hypothetical protein Tco_1263513 [Tanacetum coccineum]